MGLIEELRKINIIEENRKYNLSSGGVSSFYVNLKKALGQPDIRKLISESIWDLVKNDEITCVAASRFGGLPIATTLSDMYFLKLTGIRANPKKHGLENKFEYYLPSEKDRVLIVDDVVTTGKSIHIAIKDVTALGVEFTKAVAVVNRSNKVNVPCDYLIDVRALL